MNPKRFLKHRNLFILGLLVVTAASIAILWPTTPRQGPNDPVYLQTTETYSLDVSTNPPKWVKTLEKNEVIKRDASDMPKKRSHTTKIILPGSSVAFIEFNNVSIKKNTPTSVLLKVNGNGGGVPANTYLIVDKVSIENFHAVKMVFRTSEFVDLILTDIRSDGGLLNYDSGENVPAYPPYNEQTWDGLPGLTISNIRTDEIIIEVTGTNATVGELRFINVRIPGEILIERLKGNKFTLKSSTFGEGDGVGTTDTLIIEATVRVDNVDTTNVKQNETIDNR